MDKKIMFFIGSLSWGGAEKVITVLAHTFLNKGYDVYIVTLLSNNKVYELDNRIHYLSLSRDSKSYLSNAIYWRKSIANVLKEVKPNIVVSFVCRINLLVISAFKKSKIKSRLVISERNDPNYDTRGNMAKILTKLLYPKADILICQTSREKEYFTKKIQRISVVIPNPVFLTDSPKEFEDKKKIIINAARYDYSKNQKLLIDAFDKIINSGDRNGYELHFYGNGALKGELTKYVSSLKIDSFVKVYDSVKDIQTKIAESSIFCLSSNYEGMSNSLMEALLLGTPSISTNTSGANDLIDNGKNGYIVPVGSLNEMVLGLKTMMSSEKLLKDMYNYCLSKEYQDRFTNALKRYVEAICGEYVE